MADDAVRLDVVIFGGGAAGLWLLDVLVGRGDRVLLLEADRLGAGQTACAQGIIHGGLKYTLDGVFSSSAEAISGMPAVWRECLAGRRVPDLAGTRVRAEQCHLWRTASLGSRLGMLGARVGLKVAPRTLRRDLRPAVLAACPGVVARLDEQVIDPVSLLAHLAARHRDRILRIDAAGGLELGESSVRLARPGGGQGLSLAPRRIVLTAGAGNETLCRAAGLERLGRQQRRPLHMLLMRGALPQLNGHCVDGARTRVTITSDVDAGGRTVWHVGGQVAEDGVAMDHAEFLGYAAAEIRAVLPGLELGGVEWSSYRIDRAESDRGGRRPGDVKVAAEGTAIVAWPTKLALVPRLAEKVAEALGDPPSRGGGEGNEGPADWPRPDVAPPPWETQQQWTVDV